MNLDQSKKLPRIMYDQSQFTSLWMIDSRGLWISDEAYFNMEKISGYTPEFWIMYTQNNPEAFFFGAYSQETLDKESEIGFQNFTDKEFLSNFDKATKEAYTRSKIISDKFFRDFYNKEKEILYTKPEQVISFIREIQITATYIMSYYMLTQPQRFYKFDKEIQPYISNKDVALVSINGRYLTYSSKLRKAIIDLAKAMQDLQLSYEEYKIQEPTKFQDYSEIIDELGWLNWGILGGELITHESVKREIEILLLDEGKYKEELDKIYELVSNIDKRNKIVLEGNNHELALADIMGQSSVLRFDLQTCILALIKYADIFFAFVKEKYDLSSDDFNSYYLEEIIDLIKQGKKISKDILEQRQKGFLRMYLGKEVKTYVSQDAHNQIRDLLEFRKIEISQTKKLKGTVASWPDKEQEIIKGKAFVLMTAFGADDAIKLMKSGDILVATQTHPNLVPKMKEALAIVTDEGGITCHAAIVSRELGRPCVIGTRLATKIIKTGDMVTINLKTGEITFE